MCAHRLVLIEGNGGPVRGTQRSLAGHQMLRSLLLLALAGLAAGRTCTDAEYCCPDAKHCLAPTTKTCKESAAVCGIGETCCPLTKLCVRVGKPCKPLCPLHHEKNQYCCPDALHCLAPTRPGVLCSGNETAGRSPCWKDEVCWPASHLSFARLRSLHPQPPTSCFSLVPSSPSLPPLPPSSLSLPPLFSDEHTGPVLLSAGVLPAHQPLREAECVLHAGVSRMSKTLMKKLER
jgi:hypothetical protein